MSVQLFGGKHRGVMQKDACGLHGKENREAKVPFLVFGSLGLDFKL